MSDDHKLPSLSSSGSCQSDGVRGSRVLASSVMSDDHKLPSLSSSGVSQWIYSWRAVLSVVTLLNCVNQDGCVHLRFTSFSEFRHVRRSQATSLSSSGVSQWIYSWRAVLSVVTLLNCVNQDGCVYLRYQLSCQSDGVRGSRVLASSVMSDDHKLPSLSSSVVSPCINSWSSLCINVILTAFLTR
ncbi:hypothetical protein J6590_062877 [Homalodisca vitripennis]|nr:hypothetical protein J6590_062877 [Homalodisca vitripennis]